MIFDATSQLAPHFINTRYFREAAIDFVKNKGKYTLAPVDSKEWHEYWEEQERRCLNGYKVGGVKVTGRHYGYMNFSQLNRVSEDDQGKIVANKGAGFPSFFEIDYDWFWYKEIAWHGCSKTQLDKLHLWRNPSVNPDGKYGGGMHLGCAKARRGGFSYKEAWDGVYNYNFIPGSKSFYFAAIEDYLTDDGILNKVQADLEFLNQNTDDWWLKHRMEHNTLMHQKASYIDEDGNKAGTNSEIIGVIINDPNKTRGKDGVKITYEEAGSFKHLKESLGIAVPSVSEGITLTGQISVFGTGGDKKGVHMEGLEEIFNNPRLHKMLPFINNWEEGYEATECGVFIPTYMANPSYMDREGNVNKKAAIAYEDEVRILKKSSKDSKDYSRRIAEHPKVPSEAFLRMGNNTFPQADVLLQKNRILRSKELLAMLHHGEIVQEAGKLAAFQVKPDAKPVNYYPHKDEDDINGCITMVEAPMTTEIRGAGGVTIGVPDGVYIIVVDPYYKDEPKSDQSRLSLGAAYVVKLTSSYFGNITEQDVAWFVGRPGRSENFHEAVVKLAEIYNAKIQCEIGGGGQGLLDYCRTNKKLHLCMFEPVYINGKEIEDLTKNRSYFIDIDIDRKRNGIIYYADYLKKVVGLDKNGIEIRNLDYIYDIGLLEELLKFNDTGNFDRLSAQIVKMFTLKEKAQEKTKQRKKSDPSKRIIGHRILFADGDTKHTFTAHMKNEVI